jgi:hypothetical protein
MALPEYVGPVLAAGSPVALVLVFLRFGPDAFLRLLAGTVAVLTRDQDRGQRCLAVLRILRGRDEPPPSLPDSAPERLPEVEANETPGERLGDVEAQEEKAEEGEDPQES